MNIDYNASQCSTSPTTSTPKKTPKSKRPRTPDSSPIHYSDSQDNNIERQPRNKKTARRLNNTEQNISNTEDRSDKLIEIRLKQLADNITRKQQHKQLEERQEIGQHSTISNITNTNSEQQQLEQQKEPTETQLGPQITKPKENNQQANNVTEDTENLQLTNLNPSTSHPNQQTQQGQPSQSISKTFLGLPRNESSKIPQMFVRKPNIHTNKGDKIILNEETSIVIIGDSNTKLMDKRFSNTQIETFPGANILSITNTLIQSKLESKDKTKVEHIVISVGINDREEQNQSQLKENFHKLIKIAKEQGKNIHFQGISFDPTKIPEEQQKNITFINSLAKEIPDLVHYIPEIIDIEVSPSDPYGIHFTQNTANKLVAYTYQHLNALNFKK